MKHTHTSHLYSTYFAPRGRRRIYSLGMQLAQLYLTPFDKLIGVIGEPGSGKSALIKGMFPSLELTNDDDGVNIRPLPLLEQDSEMGFFNPHTYHLDIRFETGFTQMTVLADAILQAGGAGCLLFASAHGETSEEAKRRPFLRSLIESGLFSYLAVLIRIPGEAFESKIRLLELT